MKKDCSTAKTSPISVTTKLSAVIWLPFGRGMLMYADTQSTAAKSAISTRFWVVKVVLFLVIELFICFLLNKCY